MKQSICFKVAFAFDQEIYLQLGILLDVTIAFLKAAHSDTLGFVL